MCKQNDENDRSAFSSNGPCLENREFSFPLSEATQNGNFGAWFFTVFHFYPFPYFSFQKSFFFLITKRNPYTSKMTTILTDQLQVATCSHLLKSGQMESCRGVFLHIWNWHTVTQCFLFFSFLFFIFCPFSIFA